jgi:hypothetical protein
MSELNERKQSQGKRMAEAMKQDGYNGWPMPYEEEKT